MKSLCHVLLLLSAAAAAEAQVVNKGLILDLDADKGVEVEDRDRVAGWTNQVAGFPAKVFVKRDKGRQEPGSGRPTLRQSVAAIGGHNTLGGTVARASTPGEAAGREKRTPDNVGKSNPDGGRRSLY